MNLRIIDGDGPSDPAPTLNYVPVTFTLDDGTRVLVSLYLPPGIEPASPTIATQYENGYGIRWGAPRPADS